MEPATQQDFAKKPIHEAWERLRESRSCERFFVDILLEQADLCSLVFFLDIQTFYQVLFAQVDSDLYVSSYQDSFVNMIRTRV